MPSLNTSHTVKMHLRYLLGQLLDYANHEVPGYQHLRDEGLLAEWKSGDNTTPRLLVKAKLKDLIGLMQLGNTVGDPIASQIQQTSVTRLKDEIRNSLRVLDEFMGILEDNRTKTRGATEWRFTLYLWSKDKDNNLQQFDIAWKHSQWQGRILLRQRPYYRLPVQRHEFIGRELELSQLLQYISLEHRSPIVAVVGLGGVGKTALVLEAAYLCFEASVYRKSPIKAPKFDSIIFITAKENYLQKTSITPILQRKSTLHAIFRVIAHTLDDKKIIKATSEDQQKLVYECLNRQRTLLIVDNLDTVQDRKEVLDFLYNLPAKAKAIITSREKEVTFAPLHLGELSEVDSIRLIHQYSEEKNIQLSNEESKEIYQYLGGIPLALIYSIGQLASGYNLNDILNSEVSLSNDISQYCFEKSVIPLRGTISHLILMSLAIFRKSAVRDAITAVAGVSDSDSDSVDQGLRELSRLSLINQQEGRYVMLPLTRHFALTELLQYSKFEQEARERWVKWYLEFSARYGVRDWFEWYVTYDRLEVEWKNLLAVLCWCAEKDRYRDVRSLWKNLNHFSSLYGYWEERLFWLDWLRLESERLRKLGTTVYTMSEKGYTLTLMDQLKDAEKLLLGAWELSKPVNNNDKVFLAQNIAFLYINMEKYEDAIFWLDKADNLLEDSQFNEINRVRRETAILFCRAQVYHQMMKYALAKQLYQKMIDKAESIGWRRKRSYAQNHLAEIAIEEGNFEKASEFLEIGLPEVERNKDRLGSAYYKASFAHLEKEKGNMKQAYKWATEAKEAFLCLGMEKRLNALMELGIL